MKIVAVLTILFGLIFATLMFLVQSVSALGSVAVNEFMPHPSSGNDWVEIYNYGSSSVDLTNWQLDDNTNTSMKALSGSIAPGQFLTFDVSSRLNNDGDSVILLDNNSSQVDSDIYSADPGVDKSIGRVPDGTGGFAVLASASKGSTNGQPTPTPSSTQAPTPQPTTDPSSDPPSATPSPIPTVTPTPTPLPIGGDSAAFDDSQVSLSEYLPAPASGQNEWVELYNGSTEQANMAGWKIDDADGGSSPFTIPSTGDSSFIPPQSYKTYIMPSDRFNNDGDHVRLLKPDGTVVEDTNYTSTIMNVSWAKDANGNWQETTTLTPSAPNIITPPAGTSSTSSSASPSPTASASASPASSDGTVLGATTGSTFENDTSSVGDSDGDENLNTLLPQLATIATSSAAPQEKITAMVKSAAGHAKNVLPYIIAILIGIVGAGSACVYFFLWKKQLPEMLLRWFRAQSYLTIFKHS